MTTKGERIAGALEDVLNCAGTFEERLTPERMAECSGLLRGFLAGTSPVEREKDGATCDVTEGPCACGAWH